MRQAGLGCLLFIVYTPKRGQHVRRLMRTCRKVASKRRLLGQSSKTIDPEGTPISVSSCPT